MSTRTNTLPLRVFLLFLVAVLLSHCSNRQVDVNKEVRDPAQDNASLIQVNPMIPTAVRDLLDSADQQLSDGQVAAAIMTIKRALSISPASALVQQHLAEAFLADANYTEALYWSTLVVNQGPDQGTLCERSRRTQALAAELLNEVSIQAKALDSIASCTTQKPATF